jgi:hypothetical protein
MTTATNTTTSVTGTDLLITFTELSHGQGVALLLLSMAMLIIVLVVSIMLIDSAREKVRLEANALAQQHRNTTLEKIMAQLPEGERHAFFVAEIKPLISAKSDEPTA